MSKRPKINPFLFSGVMAGSPVRKELEMGVEFEAWLPVYGSVYCRTASLTRHVHVMLNTQIMKDVNR
jgi:hypothetical protein